ncbi:MAG: glycosyltransferase [Bryobacterales bacterium]|nr:glycosyltransferase [Bryobacterales bacterium]
MAERIKVAFASGSDDLNPQLVDRMAEIFPELPLYVVSEFPPHRGRWIPYRVNRSFRENWQRCQNAWKGKSVRLAGVLLVPGVPYRRMRLLALLASPVGFVAFNESLDSFMLRPRDLPVLLRHLAWRTRNLVRWQLRPGGGVYTFFWRLARPAEWRLPLQVARARWAGWLVRWQKVSRRTAPAVEGEAVPPGISVVIPSRDGRALLEVCLPAVTAALAGIDSEVIVVDNGSADGTREWLAAAYPSVAVESSAEPLSFAAAVNRGIARARFARVCLLNNDMAVESGFFRALESPFSRIPDLFCSTAQIFFPPGVRREETGKAVMARDAITDFPVRCDLPVEGENETYVLYGSGGCSLYDTARLRALGAVDETFAPAYCEDLDLGYRAWLRGWPSVFAAAARVEHRHRATTSRFFTQDDLDAILEINYLRFLCRAVAAPDAFRRLWGEAVERLHRLAVAGHRAAWRALKEAGRASAWAHPGVGQEDEDAVLALTAGGVAVFPGTACHDKPIVLIVSPYLPFPLSHGGAVRMYNLMRRASTEWTPVLVSFSAALDTPAPELLEICAEVVLVRQQGTHLLPASHRPDVVEEFDSPAFHAAVRQTARKWRPAIAQCEFTQMAQYAADCGPAPRILVEHDITFDLYEQLLRIEQSWETGRQLQRWRAFETSAWRDFDCVVTMSEKDRATVQGSRAIALPNGVDLVRFQPSEEAPDPYRLLFIGSFAHLPNLLAVEFFLREVWPCLRDASPHLHIIGGSRHDYFLDYYRDRVRVDLNQPGISVEGFVSDVRHAYGRAAVVIAPLVASAGTNIKIMEAMAMGKAIVTTSAGVNGLDLSDGVEARIADAPRDFAEAVLGLLRDVPARRQMEQNARAAAVARYDWDAIARAQSDLYRSLSPSGARSGQST